MTASLLRAAAAAASTRSPAHYQRRSESPEIIPGPDSPARSTPGAADGLFTPKLRHIANHRDRSSQDQPSTSPPPPLNPHASLSPLPLRLSPVPLEGSGTKKRAGDEDNGVDDMGESPAPVKTKAKERNAALGKVREESEGTHGMIEPLTLPTKKAAGRKQKAVAGIGEGARAKDNYIEPTRPAKNCKRKRVRGGVGEDNVDDVSEPLLPLAKKQKTDKSATLYSRH